MAERTRAYSASIAPGPRGLYVVTLSDARFLSGIFCTDNVLGLGCHQFTASESGDTVRFHLEDLAGGPGAPHRRAGRLRARGSTITGEAVGTAGGAVIEATGTGGVSYCRDAVRIPVRVSRGLRCSDSELRLTLTRR